MKIKPFASLALTLTLLSAMPSQVLAEEVVKPTPTSEFSPVSQPGGNKEMSITASAIPAMAAPAASPTGAPAAISNVEAMASPLRITLTQKNEMRQYRSAFWLMMSGKYATSTFTVENTGKTPIQILSAEIPERQSPEDVYARMKHSAGKRYAAMAGLGLLEAPLTFGISFPIFLLIAGPIEAAATGSYNRRMLQYVSRYPGNVKLEILGAGETRQINVLTLASVKPYLHLSVQDLSTKAVLPVQSAP